MKQSKQQKREIYSSWVVRTMIVLLTTAAIVYFMPRSKDFHYSYDIDKPWHYGQLIATFKFPIYKDEALVKQERDSVMRTFQPYYDVDNSVLSGMVDRLKATAAKDTLRYADVYVRHVTDLLDTVYACGVFSGEEYENIKQKGYTAVRLVRGNTAVSVPLSELFTTASAYEYIMSKDSVRFSRIKLQRLNVVDLLAPNVTFDEEKSDAVAHELLESVSGAKGMVQSGQKIIDRGEIVTRETYAILQSYEREAQKYESGDEKVPFILIGQTVFVLLIIGTLVSYLAMFRTDYLTNLRSPVLLFSLIAFFCIVASVMVSRNMLNVFMLPLCMAPIIIRVFLDSRTAFMFHAGMVLIISLILRSPYEFLFLQLAVGMVSIQTLRELSQRSQIYMSAFIITFGYALLYTAYQLAMGVAIDQLDMGMFIFFAINGGLLLFTYPLLWMFEKMFGFVSDVTLVELSNNNNPLLREMSEVAPGTFQHSMQVANLASEVAKKIGARAQLVRTGALYHDVGKIERPVFFTENQAGSNPHKHLTPIKSAEVIIAHVTNGLALADKHLVPQLIKNFIATHHGRSKTKYFYITYKNEHPDEQIDESLFTYPGPNPSTKEEAILMMADSVEAASRSLPEYTEESISNLVDRIIDSQMSEGYFSDCNITFREISIAKNVFKEKLKVIYHTRISYPELKGEKN